MHQYTVYLLVDYNYWLWFTSPLLAWKITFQCTFNELLSNLHIIQLIDIYCELQQGYSTTRITIRLSFLRFCSFSNRNVRRRASLSILIWKIELLFYQATLIMFIWHPDFDQDQIESTVPILPTDQLTLSCLSWSQLHRRWVHLHIG